MCRRVWKQRTCVSLSVTTLLPLTRANVPSFRHCQAQGRGFWRSCSQDLKAHAEEELFSFTFIPRPQMHSRYLTKAGQDVPEFVPKVCEKASHVRSMERVGKSKGKVRGLAVTKAPTAKWPRQRGSRVRVGPNCHVWPFLRASLGRTGFFSFTHYEFHRIEKGFVCCQC